MKTKITLKTAIKAKKGFTKKMFERFCWEKMKTKLTCFNFVVGKGLTLVTLVGRTLKITLKWLQGCQKNEQNLNDQELLRAN